MESDSGQFARSRETVDRFDYLSRAGSTNDELVRRATGPDAGSWPDLSVVVTDDQRSGRGRLGRVWVAPARKSLAISVLLRPASGGKASGKPGGKEGAQSGEGSGGKPGEAALPLERLAWVPLLAGLAMARAVASVVPTVALKWPNDLLVDGRKLCGILSELLPGLDGVVVGAGLNTALEAGELPTENATSLLIETGAPVDADAVLARYLRELTALYRVFIAANGDPTASGLLAAVTERCETIGRSVRVQLPSGGLLLGEAVSIDEQGRLVVRSDAGVTAVAAGDVTHLRY